MNIRWTGQVDEANLRLACETLHVTRPVDIYRDDLGGPAGAFEPNLEGAHTIRIDRDLSPSQANETFLHELTHAAQVEKIGPAKAKALYGLLDLIVGYNANPLEVEARAVANELADHITVVR